MRYCKEHEGRGYTEKEFDSLDICPHAGAYVGIMHKVELIHIYCFKELDGISTCVKEKT